MFIKLPVWPGILESIDDQDEQSFDRLAPFLRLHLKRFSPVWPCTATVFLVAVLYWAFSFRIITTLVNLSNMISILLLLLLEFNCSTLPLIDADIFTILPVD